jgi:hypothetical protein
MSEHYIYAMSMAVYGGLEGLVETLIHNNGLEIRSNTSCDGGDDSLSSDAWLS